MRNQIESIDIFLFRSVLDFVFMEVLKCIVYNFFIVLHMISFIEKGFHIEFFSYGNFFFPILQFR